MKKNETPTWNDGTERFDNNNFLNHVINRI